MSETYEPTLKAHVTRDPVGRARSLRHSQEYWEADSGSALDAAVVYLRDIAGVYEVSTSELDHAHVPVSYLDPNEDGPEYRLSTRSRRSTASPSDSTRRFTTCRSGMRDSR